jgi:predicted ATP-binding protein involved in virulence
MNLKRFKLENFRAKSRCELTLGSRLTVLIGTNGSGKTTVLDAIAIGLGEVLTHLPQVSGITLRRRGEIHQCHNRIAPYARITLETADGLAWDRQIKRDKARKTSSQILPALGVKGLRRFLDAEIIQPWTSDGQFDLPVIAYYGVTRALLDIPLRRRGFPSQYLRFDGLANALEANTRFRSAFAWFYSKENEEHRLQKASRSFDIVLPELQAVRRAIEGMFPDLENPHIKVNPLRFVLEQTTDSADVVNRPGYRGG